MRSMNRLLQQMIRMCAVAEAQGICLRQIAFAAQMPGRSPLWGKSVPYGGTGRLQGGAEEDGLPRPVCALVSQ